MLRTARRALLVGAAAVAAFDEHHALALERLAFGSCNKQQSPQPIWPVITNTTHPQAWFWTGDAVYAAGKGARAAKRALRAQADREDYAAFVSTLDVVDGTWDDHDLGLNDAGQDEATDARRRAYAELFAKTDDAALHARRLARYAARRGVYASHAFGPPEKRVAVILLDTRSFRGAYRFPSLGAAARGVPVLGKLAPLAAAALRGVAGMCGVGSPEDVLGEAQWAWLETQLAEAASARFVVVASSVQVLTSNPAFESWRHFPAAKARLLDALRRHAPSGVLLLSGDVHHADVSADSATTCGGAVEVTSSGLTHSLASSKKTKLLFGPLLATFTSHRPAPDAFYVGENYGELAFAWGAAPEMRARVRDAAGREVLSATVRSCPFGGGGDAGGGAGGGEL